ncbi:MAG: hypothetical protein AMS25_05415 [Gemmatimonas sp. SM23_52]|nr:MAG: hypothetical protein AMS25_05415 [Gemmatimonas sp. SM23_52]
MTSWLRCRIAALLLVLLSVSPLGAQAQERPYVDPLLRLAVQPEPARRPLLQLVPGATADSTMARYLLLTEPYAGAEPHIGVFVRLGSAGERALHRHRGLIGTRAASWVTARVPYSSLPALLREPGVRAVYAAPTALPTNDLGGADIRVSEVRTRVGHDFVGITGRGVVVGIIDTGLDLKHADFIDAVSGLTRVHRLWDQTESGTPPTGFGYGNECTGQQIDAGTCPQVDTHGHGTHVTGTAAGSGRATGGSQSAYQFTGVAPEATLVIVKTNFSFDGVVDGISYIFSVASQLGQPAVVNMSLGSDYGPHDGTRPWELMLDDLSGPGHINVASAGNSGSSPVRIDGGHSDRTHIMGTVASGEELEHQLEVWNASYIFVDLWYNGSDTLTFTLEGPSDTVSATTGDGTVVSPSGRAQISAPGERDAVNGDREAFVEILDSDVATYRLRVRGVNSAGVEPYHGWLVDGIAEFRTHFSNSHLVLTPGTATRAIEVAAYTTRESWVSIDGNTYSFGGSRSELGQITAWSSVGPRRDGVLKPEIAAPGSAIASSASAEVDEAFIALTLPDGVHSIKQGTSMSSPHAAGAVALFLQANPDLTPEDIVAVLQATGREDYFSRESYADDAGTVGLPNHTWGHGKLDVLAGLQQIVGTAAALAVAATADEPPLERIPRQAQSVELLRFDLTTGPEFVQVTDLRLTPEGSLDFAGLAVHLYVEPFHVRLLPDGAGGFELEESFILDLQSTSEAWVVADFVHGGDFGDEGRLNLTALEAEGGLSGTPISPTGLPVAGWLRRLARGAVALQLAPSGSPQPAPGTVLPGMAVPLIQLYGTTDSVEPLRMDDIALRSSIADPELRLYVVQYEPGEPPVFPGVAGDTIYRSEPFVSEWTGSVFTDTALALSLPVGAWSYEIGALLSPAAGHGSQVQLKLDPDSVCILGVISGDSAQQLTSPDSLLAGRGGINLLESDEAFGLSANPVRGQRVVFTFGTRPRAVSVFNFAGERVRLFRDADIEGLEGGPARIVWEPIENDRGSELANGVYLLVIEHADGRVERQRLMILRGRR